MKLRHPGLIGLVALLGSCIVRLWMSTLRFRMFYSDDKIHPTDGRLDPHIYAFWHEALLFPTAFKARANILISQHADGELIARVVKHLGFGVVRGSTSRGGMAGLMCMVHKSNVSHLIITPDGPRGPRRQFQIGAILLASMTGLPVTPLGLTFGSAWRAPSWDRMLLPVPWSAAYGVVGTPIYVPPDLGREGLEHYRALVEVEMTRVNEAAERWAREGRRPAKPWAIEQPIKMAA
jgi:lysophospholipid acyltransferase (LPLAT)-like uncharacterized protein